jgi:hypothetical protein
MDQNAAFCAEKAVFRAGNAAFCAESAGGDPCPVGFLL